MEGEITYNNFKTPRHISYPVGVRVQINPPLARVTLVRTSWRWQNTSDHYTQMLLERCSMPLILYVHGQGVCVCVCGGGGGGGGGEA